MSSERILFVDDWEYLRRATCQTLDLAGLSATPFADAEAALPEVSRNFPGILITDIRMAGMDGLTLMQRALEIDPEFPVILVTGYGDIDLAAQSMRDGAYDFPEKPYDPVRLVETARRTLDKRRLTLEITPCEVGLTAMTQSRRGWRAVQAEWSRSGSKYARSPSRMPMS